LALRWNESGQGVGATDTLGFTTGRTGTVFKPTLNYSDPNLIRLGMIGIVQAEAQGADDRGLDFAFDLDAILLDLPTDLTYLGLGPMLSYDPRALLAGGVIVLTPNTSPSDLA
jgi:iron complex outermembrane receptor protein